MTINFTIFVQIINFIIAYFIISRILLRPAIEVIQKDQEAENDLLKSIEKQEEKVKDKQGLKQALWTRALDQFTKDKPSFESKPEKVVWQVPTPKDISADLKKRLEDETASLIINKVKHVEQ